MIDTLVQVLDHAHRHVEELWFRRAFWVALLSGVVAGLTHVLGVMRAFREWLVRKLAEDEDE